MTTQETTRVCPTCMGKVVIEGVCEVSAEWNGIKTADQQQCTPDNICSGQICTPDNICPTCNGKGYVRE
jgi:hypothetical protein